MQPPEFPTTAASRDHRAPAYPARPAPPQTPRFAPAVCVPQHALDGAAGANHYASRCPSYCPRIAPAPARQRNKARAKRRCICEWLAWPYHNPDAA
jgi:hypothetical protein